MNTQPTTSRLLPAETRHRMQLLLDEGDKTFFERHPGEQTRTRMHFRGEVIDDSGAPTRYIVVTRRPDGTLTRCFQQEGGRV